MNSITTPAAIVDVRKMRANIRRMQQRMDLLGVKFRPHVKTTKCVEIVRDILYAVEVAPAKLAKALERRLKGCDLKLCATGRSGAHRDRAGVAERVDVRWRGAGSRRVQP